MDGWIDPHFFRELESKEMANISKITQPENGASKTETRKTDSRDFLSNDHVLCPLGDFQQRQILSINFVNCLYTSSHVYSDVDTVLLNV